MNLHEKLSDGTVLSDITPLIALVKTADFGNLDHRSSIWRLHRAGLRRVLFQRQVHPRPVIVVYVAPWNSPQVRFALARFYGLFGNLEFSRQQCEEVLRLDPPHLGARVLLAEILMQQGEEAERSESLLREVVDAAPGSTEGRRAAELLARR